MDSTSTHDGDAIELKIEVVIIPVADVDRAKQFYERLGWRLDADFAIGDTWRVVQLTPPGSPCSIIFGKGITTAAPGSVQGSFLVVDDVTAARAALVERGANMSDVFHFEGGLHVTGTEGRLPGPHPEGQSYRSWASFDDPDGNSWLLQEIRTRLPGRGLDMDVQTMIGVLREAEERHGSYEASGPKHHWSQWYGAYSSRAHTGPRPNRPPWMPDITSTARAHNGRGPGWPRISSNEHTPFTQPRLIMRPDIVPGTVFPDYALTDHHGKRRTLSELQQDDPLVLVLARGGYCPKDRRQHEGLLQLHRETEVGYCRLVTASTDNLIETSEFRLGVGASWPFLSDPARKVQKDLDIAEYTDLQHNPMVPHTLVLEPGLRIFKIYNGYWFFGRPTVEELRLDLRAVLQRCRPDWDIGGADMRNAWTKGDKTKFYPYGKTQAQVLSEPD